jgi:hypothetical protein
VYDFGEWWAYEVVVEGRARISTSLAPLAHRRRRRRTARDCGGIDGFAALPEALRDPEHEAYEEMRAWEFSAAPLIAPAWS